MGKGDEERMWEGKYFFIHFILLMKKKHFCLVRFFKHSGKEPLLVSHTVKMKIQNVDSSPLLSSAVWKSYM